MVIFVLLLGFGTLRWSLTHREKLHGLATGIAKVIAKIRRKSVDHSKIEIAVVHLLEGWDALIRGGWRTPVLGAVLNTGFDRLTLGCLFWSAGYPAPASLFLPAYG